MLRLIAGLSILLALPSAAGATGTPPPEWTCLFKDYNDGYGYCDCGCGAIDPDCPVNATRDHGCFSTPSLGSCWFDPALNASNVMALKPYDIAHCYNTYPSPGTWNCDPNWYGAHDGCDCGCGLKDPDCASSSASACHYFSGCSYGDPSKIQTFANHLCTTSQFVAPVGWQCVPTYYGANDGCDCGCGIVDPDCGTSSASACQYQYCPLGFAPFAANNESCQPMSGYGTTWLCQASWYGAGDGCDCGCGKLDPDCTSTRSSACDYKACGDVDPWYNYKCAQ